MRIVLGFIALVSFAATAAAQTAPSSPAPAIAPPPAAAAAPAQPATKPVDCRAQAQAKGLRGQAARDAIALCVEELRAACLKEAIDKKIVGKDRATFIRSCSGRPKTGDKGGKG
jgi:hypothetical protein